MVRQLSEATYHDEARTYELIGLKKEIDVVIPQCIITNQSFVTPFSESHYSNIYYKLAPSLPYGQQLAAQK